MSMEAGRCLRGGSNREHRVLGIVRSGSAQAGTRSGWDLALNRRVRMTPTGSAADLIKDSCAQQSIMQSNFRNSFKN